MQPILINPHLNSLDQQIADKHLLTHPFYLAWTRGELGREALRDYARQYYQHVAAFPTYLSAAHAGCEDQPTRRKLLANLIDEEAGTPNHPELWQQFADGLGVDRDELATTKAQPETKRLIDTFRAICRDGSTAEALAALYAYESQIPEICESKIDGLKKHYGFANPEHYEYFTVHLEADREHRAAERTLLQNFVTSESAQAIKASAARVLDALWNFLNGVCERHAIAC